MASPVLNNIPNDELEKGALAEEQAATGDAVSTRAGETIAYREDLLGREDLDPALIAKTHLAIDEIGWTAFHWKLFALNGFGYAVDSTAALLQSVIASQAYLEIGNGGFANGLTVALYSGLLVGALFWGCWADIFGRRSAFNATLFICSVATIVAGAAPSWESLGFFIAMLGFGAGGNLVLDPAVFLEFLPSRKQWAVTAMACWWGFGQALTGFIAWGFLTKAETNCRVAEQCNWSNNRGWRLCAFVTGSIILVMSIARVTVVRLEETPKYLLSVGRDEDAVRTLQNIASKYGRPCSLTVDSLRACGIIRNVANTKKISGRRIARNLSGLFRTRRLALSTILVWFSWTLIGMAYPLFYVFLPAYLTTHVKDARLSAYETWRNYTLVNISTIFGPLLAALLINIRVLGRKFTMVIGALFTMAFFFGYTTVSTKTQNLVFSCVVSFGINIYYGTLYAYTAEVFPSSNRTTGNGIAVSANRMMGLLSAVVAEVSNTSSAAPLYVCAALFTAIAVTAACFPFEPQGRRSF